MLKNLSQAQLYRAIAEHRVDIVTDAHILCNTLNCFSKNTHFQTPLMEACGMGNVKMVQALLNKGALVNIPSSISRKGPPPRRDCALVRAIRQGHVDIVEILLSKRACVSCAGDGEYDPLALAAGACSVDIIELLLAAGADASKVTTARLVALISAAATPRVGEKVVRRLMEANAAAFFSTGRDWEEIRAHLYARGTTGDGDGFGLDNAGMIDACGVDIAVSVGIGVASPAARMSTGLGSDRSASIHVRMPLEPTKNVPSSGDVDEEMSTGTGSIFPVQVGAGAALYVNTLADADGITGSTAGSAGAGMGMGQGGIMPIDAGILSRDSTSARFIHTHTCQRTHTRQDAATRYNCPAQQPCTPNVQNSPLVAALLHSEAVRTHGYLSSALSTGTDHSRGTGSYTMLSTAVINGHLSGVCALLGSGVDVNEKNYHGSTALTVAALIGDNVMVDLLLKARACIYYGVHTPVELGGGIEGSSAIDTGDTTTNTRIIGRNTGINMSTGSGVRTPTGTSRLAAYAGVSQDHSTSVSTSAIGLYIGDCCWVNTYDDTLSDRRKYMKTDDGMSVRGPGTGRGTGLPNRAAPPYSNSRTAGTYRSCNGRGHYGASALVTAVEYGHVEVVRTLLCARADPHTYNSAGIPALSLAVATTDTTGTTAVTSTTPTTGADGYKDRSTQLVPLLVQAKAELEVVDKHGHTPLMTAIIDGRMDVARLLLEARASIYVPMSASTLTDTTGSNSIGTGGATHTSMDTGMGAWTGVSMGNGSGCSSNICSIDDAGECEQPCWYLAFKGINKGTGTDPSYDASSSTGSTSVGIGAGMGTGTGPGAGNDTRVSIGNYQNTIVSQLTNVGGYFSQNVIESVPRDRETLLMWAAQLSSSSRATIALKTLLTAVSPKKIDGIAES